MLLPFKVFFLSLMQENLNHPSAQYSSGLNGLLSSILKSIHFKTFLWFELNMNPTKSLRAKQILHCNLFSCLFDSICKKKKKNPLCYRNTLFRPKE